MKARITKLIDLNNRDFDLWGIMIQLAPGKRYNKPLTENGTNIYSTFHKGEAIEKVKKLNKKFREEA